MSNQRFLEWVHGEKEARMGSLPEPKEPGKPVTEVEVFEDTTSKVLTAEDLKAQETES